MKRSTTTWSGALPRVRVMAMGTLCGLLLAAPSSWGARHPARRTPPRVATAHYYGPSVAGWPGLTWNDPQGPFTPLGEGGLGAVQFPLRSSDVSVTLFPEDAAGSQVGATARFFDKAGAALTPLVGFCGSARGLVVPARATALRVSLDPTICPSPVTQGSVTATIAQRRP